MVNVKMVYEIFSFTFLTADISYYLVDDFFMCYI